MESSVGVTPHEQETSTRERENVLGTFVDRISPTHFRRMFRMTLQDFSTLCQKIKECVGEDRFRSEEFIASGGLDNKPNFRVVQRQGGYVSGEIRTAISLRMLAGGSYLDLAPLFDVVTSQVYDSVDIFIEWVLETFTFPLVEWLRQNQWEKLHLLAKEFATKTGGVYYGCFGAIDGMACRITLPTLKEVTDPGNYYCRKGFYALNIQATSEKSVSTCARLSDLP